MSVATNLTRQLAKAQRAAVYGRLVSTVRGWTGGNDSVEFTLLPNGAKATASRAGEKLKIEWSNAAPAFPETAGIYDHIRKAPVRKRDEGKPVGNVDDAMRGAARWNEEWSGVTSFFWKALSSEHNLALGRALPEARPAAAHC